MSNLEWLILPFVTAVIHVYSNLHTPNEGGWYDQITRWLGINKNNYYRAGHAAIVLIEKDGEMCHCFDFGRYHAPFQHGRARFMVCIRISKKTY